jgi:uncharacterized protein (TIGR02271 family)
MTHPRVCWTCTGSNTRAGQSTERACERIDWSAVQRRPMLRVRTQINTSTAFGHSSCEQNVVAPLRLRTPLRVSSRDTRTTMNSTPSTDRNELDTEGSHAAHLTADAHAARERTVVPVLEEELDVRRRRVETGGGVRVEKTVDEYEACVDEPLTKEEVEVERVALGLAVEGPVAVRYEGDTMIVPILEEVLVVEKRLVLKEEIRITRRRRELHAPQRVTLRREHATVERIGDTDPHAVPAAGGSTSSYEDSSGSLLDEKRRHNEEVLRKLR